MNTPTQSALVVEDDHSWQGILRELLEDAGLSVDVADSYETALPLLSGRAHRVAVVDLSLVREDHNNRDGLRVLEALRLRDPGCVTILLTGFATVELAVQVLTDYGGFTCLQKELFQRNEFRALLRRALATSGVHAGLPKQAPEPETARPTGQADTGPEPRGRVLLVEDDAGWRAVLTELLHDAGFSVRACAGYGEALGCLRRRTYDLAVIDLSLSNDPPGSADEPLGYRLLSAAHLAGLHAIIVSGVAAPDEIERAYGQEGVFAFLEKQTFDRRAFVRVVEEAIAAGFPPAVLPPLTGRERQVLRLLAQGRTNKEIADALVISTNTVKRHQKAIFHKLGVHTRAAAAALFRGEPGPLAR